jgi:aerobic carbon-monoxide dehydrogenase medium subunit
VIPTEFAYQRATSLDDALARLAAAGGQAKLLAGGHSLIPLMKLRLSEPQVLIDIARIPGLTGIKQKDGKIEIGAGTVHHDVASSSLIREQCPVVAEAAYAIGDPQVRNRGTLGGSLAHADPSADYPAAMIAAGAEIQIRSTTGTRSVKAEDFFIDLFTVDLQADEIVTAVLIEPAKLSAYAKLHQRASHFAIVGVGASLDVSGGTVTSARVGLTGASTHATRLTKVESGLAGKQATKETIEQASRGAGADLEVVNSDLHGSEEYRRSMVEVFVRRALLGALVRG